MSAKILIVSTNAIGDTYLSAAAIAPLRKHFGDKCEIHLLALADTENATMLADALDVDVVWRLSSKSLTKIFECYLKLIRIQFDHVFSFFPGRVNTFFLMLIRSRVRTGFPNIAKVTEWYNLQQKVYCSFKNKGNFVWRDGMAYLERVGLCFTAGGIHFADLSKPILRLPANGPPPLLPFTIVHFTSRRKDRALNPNAQSAVLSYLCSHADDLIVVLGWKGETELLKERFRSNTRVTFLEDALLPALVHYIVSARLFIAVDSFPLHVADAYGTNYIGIFGPTHPEAFQSCLKSLVFHCNDLSSIDGQNIINGLVPLLAK
ncbi:MAG: glycosyltransferase family 9 protein [Bacteroidota bacterium]